MPTFNRSSFYYLLNCLPDKLIALLFSRVLSKYPSSELFSLFRILNKNTSPYRFFFSFPPNIHSILVSILDSSSFPTESKAASLTRAIAEFQRDTGRTKRFRINPDLQAFVNSLLSLLLLKPALPKCCTRATREPLPSYDCSWLIDPDKFPAAMSRFEEIIANSQVIDTSLQQSITSAVLSAFVIAVAAIQAKHENEMLSLWEMIEKSLLLKESLSNTPPPDLNAIPKALLAGDSLPKASTKRWNQADLGYFDPHLDRVHGEDEIVLVGKDVYYRNVVLFVQRLQSLVTFRGASLVKANIDTFLQGCAPKWYTSELSNFDRNALNNDQGVKSWVNTLSHRFKVSTNVAFGLLRDETYSLDDARAQRLPAQYVRTIMRYNIGYNIIDVANWLSFAYRDLVLKLWVFILPPTELTKTADFICALEEK